jgi:hypothetical protein
MAQIGDTLIENRTARLDTDIGTGQIVLLPSTLLALSAALALWVAHAASVAANEQIKMKA